MGDKIEILRKFPAHLLDELKNELDYSDLFSLLTGNPLSQFYIRAFPSDTLYLLNNYSALEIFFNSYTGVKFDSDNIIHHEDKVKLDHARTSYVKSSKTLITTNIRLSNTTGEALELCLNEKILKKNSESTLYFGYANIISPADKNKKELLSISDISRELHSTNTYERIGEILFNKLKQYYPQYCLSGKLGVYDIERDSYREVYLMHDYLSIAPNKKEYKLSELELFTGETLRNRKVIVINDNHSEYATAIDPKQKEYVRSSFIFFPLFFRDKLVGNFSLACPKINTFDSQFIEYITYICGVTGNALGNLLNTEQKLRIEQQYSLIVNEQTELICRLNKEYILVFTNKAFMDFFDSNEKYLSGNNFLHQLTVKERGNFLFFLNSITPDKPITKFESEISDHKEIPHWMEWVVRADYDISKKTVVEYQLVGRDITERKTYETKILEKQKFINSISKTAPNYLFLADVQSDNIIYFNRPATELIGVNPFNEKIPNIMDLKPFIHPDDMGNFARLIREIRIQKDNKIRSLEIRLITPDEKTVYCLIRYSVFKRDCDNNVKETIFSISDITENKIFSLQLKDRNDFIQGIINATQNIVHIGNIKQKNLLFASPAACNFLKIKPSENIGDISIPIKDFVFDKDFNVLEKLIEGLSNANDGEVLSLELRIINQHNPNDIRWMLCRESVYSRDENGCAELSIGIAMDITEKKRLENQILNNCNQLELAVEERTTRLLLANDRLQNEIIERKKTENRLTKKGIILDSISDGVITINVNAEILYFNKGAETITGYGSKEVIGKPLRNHLCFTEDEPKAIKFLETDILRNQTAEIIRKDKTRSLISINTSKTESLDGNSGETIITFRDITQINLLKKELEENESFCGMISQNEKMLKIFSTLPIIAESDATVLIEGQTGTGKELLAKAVHTLSKRSAKPYITINCATIPSTLLESELFGFVKGAFTDARQDKEGKIVAASGGTVFFDEIGEMPINLQAKLLRLLENFEVEPIGSLTPLKADIRVVFATNKNILQMVSEGTFREDLYYRMNTVKYVLPPLKNRIDDLPFLVNHFINRLNVKTGKNINGLSADVMNILRNYNFPGNIRELNKIIEYAFIICDEQFITNKHLPPDIVSFLNCSSSSHVESNISIENERELIISLLHKHKTNKAKVAREMGIHYTTLWRKMKKFGLIDEANN